MITETRQHAHDRGYQDGYEGLKAGSGYAHNDRRPQVASRILAYYTGYGEGVFARREGRLPSAKDKDPRGEVK